MIDIISKFAQILLIFLFSILKGYSCICFQPTVENSFKKNNHIFVGKSTLIDSIYKPLDSRFKYIFEIKPMIQFKGSDRKKFIYKTNGNSCNLSKYFFEGDQKYLFYFNLHDSNKDSIILSSCQRNVPENVNTQHAKHLTNTNYEEDIKKLYKLNPKPKIIREKINLKGLILCIVVLILITGIFKSGIFKKKHNK